MNSSLQGPTAAKIPKELSQQGQARIDNYYWLNERENPKVIDYLNAENEYTSNVMKPLKGFQENLFEEMKARIKETDSSVPYFSDGWYYYLRYEEGQEYPIYCRKEGDLEAEENILLDVNVLAKGHEYYDVSGMSISPNKKVMAYGVDTLSRRIYIIHFKNLETGENFSQTIENTTGSSSWSNDNKTLFYTKKDKALRSFQIWKYNFGNGVNTAELVFEESDETFNCFVYKSKSKKYIFIGSSSTLSSEYQFVDADFPDQDFNMLQPRENELEYGIGHLNDDFYILTNWQAKNFRLMVVNVDAPEKENWKEVIPHRKDVLIEDIELFSNFILLEERIEGISNIRVINRKTKEDHYVNFGEKAYTAYASTNLELDTHILRLAYTSLTTPSTHFDYDMNTREFTLLKEQEILGVFDKEDYKSERLMVKVRDGVKVPVSLVYHKNTNLDRTAPILLYGYGSYGHNIDPYFSSGRLSLLNRGFIYAIAHIRGSETLGRTWYEDGKMMNKKNTFFDFIDCGKYLVEKKYGSPEKLFAMGGSAGGLLMGAIVNYEPKMWKAIVAQVPFVDVLTTMLDESIPLTTGEFDEWGNPKQKEAYDYIKTYSPYDNVEPKDYPNMLITTGLHDSQVQYWEPAKWVAKLRELKTDDNILLLKTQMDFGHSGASGRFEGLKEVALEYAFILNLAGSSD
jgi:oligopeptidase B|tara:strand:+ start:275 stop:2326 length:2052 start_codon:yes stop_codon:yes gene_type:complete